MTKHPDSTLQRLNTQILEASGWPPFGGVFDVVQEWPAVTKTGVPPAPVGPAQRNERAPAQRTAGWKSLVAGAD